MVQLFVFLFYILSIASIIGYGSLIFYFQRINLYIKVAYEFRLTLLGVFGFIFLSIIGLLINFIFPLNIFISLTIILFGIFLLFLNSKMIFNGYEKSDFLIIFLILSFFFIFVLLKCVVYDTGLYHISSVNWIKGSTVPFGLVNLHSRLAFNSTWFILGAIFEPLKELTHKNYFIINAIAIFFYALAAFLLLKNLKTNNFTLSKLFYIFTLIPCYLKINETINSLSYDLPVVILTFLIIYLCFLQLEELNSNDSLYLIIILFSLYAVTIKVSAFPLIIFSIFLFLIKIVSSYKNFVKISYYYFDLVILSCCFIFLIMPWIIKSVMLSGCIIYPMQIGHFSNLKWAVSNNQIISEIRSIKSWARMPGISPDIVLSNWNWTFYWISEHKREFRLPLLLFIVSIVLYLYSLVMNKEKTRKQMKIKSFRILLIILALNTVGIIFWFLTAPDLRFGLGFLYSFVIVFLTFSLVRNNNFITKIEENYNDFWKNKTIHILLIIFLFFLPSSLSSVLLFNLLYLIVVSIVCYFFYKSMPKLSKIMIVLSIFLNLIYSNEYLRESYKTIFDKNTIPRANFVKKKIDYNVDLYIIQNNDLFWDAPLLSTSEAIYNKGIKVKFFNNWRHSVMFWNGR